jgi:hypothetical protein
MKEMKCGRKKEAEEKEEDWDERRRVQRRNE